MSVELVPLWFLMAWTYLVLALPGAATIREPPPDCPLPPTELRSPHVDVRRFGAVGDGVHDDTFAINAAIASLENGGTVEFSPGTYRHDGLLKVDRRDVALVGQRTRLLAGRPSQGAILLSGDGSSLRDLDITSADPGPRGDRDEQSGIVVSGQRNTVFGVKVSKAKSAGILLLGARDFLVACSDVSDTKADGIHVSRAAMNGRVAFNTVRNSEDDGIAVVSYRPDKQASRITIEDNRVEQIRWGRGIAVVGSRDVVVRRNTVRSIAMAAGIIVAREAYWNTHGARNVVIEGNRISDVQQSLAPLDGRERTGQAAIDLNSDDDDPALAVTDVKIASNVVSGSGYDGIRLNGNVTRVTIADNTLAGVKRSAIFIVRKPPGQVVDCQGASAKMISRPCAID